MLKIKFNINEFTIIFLRRFEGKQMLKNQLFSALSLFQPSFSFSFSTTPFFFFFCFSLFSISAPLLFQSSACFSPFFQRLTFSFLQTCCPFFSPKYFFSPKRFSVQPKRLATLTSAPLFFFSFLVSTSFFSSFFFSYVFKGQPKTCCSPKSPLNLSNSCVPLCQDEVKPPASKPRGTRFSCKFSSHEKKINKSSFSLHSSKIQYSLQLLRLFYLNKSSFSSNLQ